MNRISSKWMVAVVTLICGTAALAGTRVGYSDCEINLSSRLAHCNLADARDATSGSTYVKCELSTYSTGTQQYVHCQARNAAGDFAYCSSTNPNFVSVVQAMGDDSLIYFKWDANYACTYLEIDNSSVYAPRAQ